MRLACETKKGPIKDPLTTILDGFMFKLRGMNGVDSRAFCPSNQIPFVCQLGPTRLVTLWRAWARPDPESAISGVEVEKDHVKRQSKG
jgi:hypothetical protein